LFFLKKRGLAAGVFLLSRREMRKINLAFRKKNQATNVLSFVEPRNFVLPPSRFRKIGEIYLCPDFIVKKKQSFELMVVHGILHLLRYGHRNRKERARMERKEEKILKFLTEKRFS
jgi:probable rRNA maturation factor